MKTLDWYVRRAARRIKREKEVTRIARLVADSPPRSAQLVRLLSSLQEAVEELDEE